MVAGTCEFTFCVYVTPLPHREILFFEALESPDVDAYLFSVVEDGLTLRLWDLFRFKH